MKRHWKHKFSQKCDISSLITSCYFKKLQLIIRDQSATMMEYDVCTTPEVCRDLFNGHYTTNFPSQNHNVIKNYFLNNSNCNYLITMKFCKPHESTAVMTQAKFCADLITWNWVKAKIVFQQIWIVTEKTFEKKATEIKIGLNCLPFYIQWNFTLWQFLNNHIFSCLFRSYNAFRHPFY